MIDYTIDGKCSENCGKCCTRVLPYSDHEIKKIRQYVRRNEIKPAHLNFDSCPFLTNDKRCQVYIHRGEICKSFICNTHLTTFNHRDKKMVDLWQEFYPDLTEGVAPNVDVKALDEVYQFKKQEIYGR